MLRKDDEQQYFGLLHLDGVGTFAENAQATANLIVNESRAILAADCRFFHGHEVDAEKFVIDAPRFYKPLGLKPWQIDNLYSEVQLMKLKLE